MTETILVTGSSRGIGRAIALRLARSGYDIVLHCRSRRDEAEAVQAQIAELGRQARILQFDVSDRAACRAALEADVEQHGAYYGVVCNAGLTRDGAFPALSDDDWDQVLRTNLDGFYNVLHPLTMPMIRRRQAGRIVCITSVSGLIGNRGQVNYSASKAGLIGAAKALAIELGKRRITADTALRLSRFFGLSERFWMNLQGRYDLEVEKDRLKGRLEQEVKVYSTAA